MSPRRRNPEAPGRGWRARQPDCTVCGLPLSGENLYVRPDTGHRGCRTCRRRRVAELRDRRRAGA